LTANRDGALSIIVLSDGEPHDIDVHDPRYLVEDARHAVRAAARSGVRVVCLLAGARHATCARRIFSHQGVQAVDVMDDVPRALRRLFIDAAA
jgi:nitric oxide reductase activation protein